ncbi:trans-sialidase [Trypanosoma cruzi]|nr:trans-sialidase [Trypanosoma cruzi]
MECDAASWVDEGPLLLVAFWAIAHFVCVLCWLRGCGRIPLAVGLNWRRWRCASSRPLVGGCWRCVRLLCGGPNSLRWCECECEGWCGVAGQGEGRGGAFPACRLFLPCVLCCLLLFSPVILSSCVPAWSGRMLTGHVDCECLLTASISLSHSLPVIPCWVGRVAPREGWPAHTDGLSRIAVLLLFSVGDGPPCCPFRILLCPAVRVGALLCFPRTCLMYCRFFLPSLVERIHTLGKKLIPSANCYREI